MERSTRAAGKPLAMCRHIRARGRSSGFTINATTRLPQARQRELFGRGGTLSVNGVKTRTQLAAHDIFFGQAGGLSSTRRLSCSFLRHRKTAHKCFEQGFSGDTLSVGKTWAFVCMIIYRSCGRGTPPRYMETFAVSC